MYTLEHLCIDTIFRELLKLLAQIGKKKKSAVVRVTEINLIFFKLSSVHLLPGGIMHLLPEGIMYLLPEGIMHLLPEGIMHLLPE